MQAFQYSQYVFGIWISLSVRDRGRKRSFNASWSVKTKPFFQKLNILVQPPHLRSPLFASDTFRCCEITSRTPAKKLIIVQFFLSDLLRLFRINLVNAQFFSGIDVADSVDPHFTLIKIRG